MLDKLIEIESKFDIIERELEDPGTVSDIEKYRNLMRERKTLLPIVEKFREYKRARDEQEAAETMLPDADDADMKKMIIDEISVQKEEQKRLLEELQILL